MYTHHGPMLYLTKDDQVVEEGDPRAATVLVADGGQLPDDVAEKYGLIGETPAVRLTPDEEQKAKAAQPNKAKSAPDNKSKG